MYLCFRVIFIPLQVAPLQETRPLPSAIALGKEGFALGKAFAECCTRQRAVGISPHGKGFFAECRMSSTWQRISRVPRRHSAKKSHRDGQVTMTAPLPSATRRHSAKKCVFYFYFKNALPSARIWHSAKLVFFFLDFLCRVL